MRFRVVLLVVLGLVFAEPTIAEVPTRNEAPKRHQIPNAGAVKSATAQIHEAFKEAYLAKGVAAKTDLARKLIQLSQETTEDQAIAYTALLEAANQAAEAGEVMVVLEALDLATAEFALSRLSLAELKFNVLTVASRAHSPAPELAGAFVISSDNALAASDVTLAGRAGAMAVTASRKTSERGAAVRAQEQIARVAKARSEYAGVVAAQKKLLADPSDATGNLIVGRWLCFWSDDFDGGIDYFLKCGEPTLLAAAKAEVAARGSDDAAILLAAGDAWWAVAEMEKGQRVRFAYPPGSRAGNWYLKSISSQSGLARKRVETRVKSLDAEAPIPLDAEWISRRATYTVAAQYLHFKGLPSLLDGRSGGYSSEGAGKDFSFVSDPSDPSIIISLGRTVRITGFEIINRRDNNTGDRAKTLTIWTGDTSAGPWQKVWSADGVAKPTWRFGLGVPRSGRYVKMGLQDANQFHLAGVKIFGTEAPQTN